MDSLHTAAEIMWHADCGCVPVTDENKRVVGVITDRDICMAAHIEGEPLRERTVGGSMSNSLCVCQPDDTLETVAAVMSERQVRRLPVVDSDGRLVGIVSLNDLALNCTRGGRASSSSLSADAVAATLAAISRHRPNVGSAEPH
jgi:CBS domain-containing protein